MINYTKQFIDKQDINSVVNVLKSDFITQGKKINEFEKKLMNYFGSKNAVVVSNATMALYLLAKALKWGKNDIVLCSPLSFLSASNAVLMSNANPCFIDIDYTTGNISVDSIKKKILKLDKKGKKIKAIIVVDYGGLPAEWEEIKKIARRNKAVLINDNCHALGAKFKNNKKYAIKYSDYVIQSYHPAKNITTGEGGSILSNNSAIIDKIKILRNHGTVKNKNMSPWLYEMQYLSYNARITDFQCALGISQLKKLDKIVNKKTKIADYYNKKFNNIKNIETPKIFKDRKSAFHLYPLKINFNNLKITKQNFFIELKRNKKINLQVHYIPIYKQKYYKKNVKVLKNEFKASEKFYNHVISLPIYYSLSKNQIDFVSRSIINLVNKYDKKN